MGLEQVSSIGCPYSDCTLKEASLSITNREDALKSNKTTQSL